MKTTVNSAALKLVLLVVAVIGLLTGPAYAGTPKVTGAPNAVFIVASLAPVVPIVAGFTDTPFNTSYIYSNLQPVTPKEATFDDSGIDAYAALNLITSLRPAVPAVADFTRETDLESLAPALPEEAGYDY